MFKSTLLTPLAILFMWGSAVAAIDFESLKSLFDERIADLETEYKTSTLKLEIQYAKHLETLLDDAQESGDLDAALAIRKAKEVGGKIADLPQGAPGSLVSAKGTFDKAITRRRTEFMLAVAKLKSTYTKRLGPMVAATTKTGDLDTALAIREESERYVLSKEEQELLAGQNTTISKLPRSNFFRSPKDELADLSPITEISARPLVLGDPATQSGWQEIPPKLAGGVARIWDQEYHKHVGVVKFEVIADGNVYAIGNWHYQGSGGSWENERLKPEDFAKHGWKKLRKPLVKFNGDSKDVYYKHFKVGETVKLRTNKYTPPFLICRAKVK